VRNIELKARLEDPEAAREVAVAVGGKRLGVQYQVDCYFHCRRGRLKLRQIDGLSAELIWYRRPDERGPKASEYLRVAISEPEVLKAALAAAWGIRVVVEKRREIFLVDNVRIHLDEVVGLGHFLEFEAVLGPEVDDPQGIAQLEDLAEKFSIGAGDRVAGSYADLVEAG